MTAGMTRKPCPMCKTTGPRPADGICRLCEDELERLREYERKHGAYEEAAVDAKDIIVPTWWPGPYSDGLSQKRRSQIDAAMLAIVEGFPPSKKPECVEGMDSYGEQLVPKYDGIAQRRRMSPEAIKAVRTLVEVLPVAFDEAYASGVEFGRNALLQLASGDATVADFDASVSTESYRAARRRRQ